jgi:hypothetical protein
MRKKKHIALWIHSSAIICKNARDFEEQTHFQKQGVLSWLLIE